MKRKLLFLMVMFAGLFANAQETSVLDIEGLAVSPEATATKSYYLKNVGTGLYLSYGGEWGTHCIETNAAHPIALETNGSYVAIGSLLGYLESNTLWMDSTKVDSKWKLEPAEGYTNQYYLVGDGGRVLTSVGHRSGLLTLQTNESEKSGLSKAMQRWVFLTEDEMRNRMPDATAQNPLDVTPFIKAATFDLVDGFTGPAYYDKQNDGSKNPDILKNLNQYNKNWVDYEANDRWIYDYVIRSWNAYEYNSCGVVDGGGGGANLASQVVIKQENITLPAGTYHFSFEGLYSYKEKVVTQNKKYTEHWFFGTYYTWDDTGNPTTTTEDGEYPATVTITGLDSPIPFKLCTTLTALDGKDETYIPAANEANQIFRDNDIYKQEATFTLNKETDVAITITIPKKRSETTTETGQTEEVEGNIKTVTTKTYIGATYCFDEFALQYYGPEESATVDQSNLYAPYLEANIAEYKEFFNEAGDAKLEELLADLDINAVDTKTEYYDAIAKVEQAYAQALAEHTKANALENPSGDFTGAIINNSFEMGDLTGWTVSGYGAETGVKMNSDGVYTTAGVDGVYLFNTWDGDGVGYVISQTVDGLPKGKYTLKVLVTSHNGYTLTATVNGTSATHTIAGDKGTFEEVEVTFNVGDDGLAAISLSGSGWYKADNFRLYYTAGLTLNETSTTLQYANGDYYETVAIDRTMPYSNWSTLVVPFDMDVPYGWDVREFTRSFYNTDKNGDECLNLHFSKVAEIEAGVPYLVRQTRGSNMTLPVQQDVEFGITAPISVETECATFTGTFVKSEIPAGAYYLSGNKFYKTTSAVATKGFRAWFVPKDANVKMLSFSFDEEGEATDIEDVQGATEEPIVVAIYGIDGTLRTEMQKGLNIVKMSNGKVKKVLVP